MLSRGCVFLSMQFSERRQVGAFCT